MPVARRPWNTGVYAIRNKVNGKVYVGSAAGKEGIRGRWRLHRHQLIKGKHHNRYLQRAWDKYGCDAFEFLVVLICHPDRCLANEQVYIDQYSAYEREKGYNIEPVATSSKGVERTDEYRRKQSAAQTGKIASTETREKLSRARKGVKKSVEHRARMSVAQEGRVFSDAHREKLSIAARSRWMRRFE